MEDGTSLDECTICGKSRGSEKERLNIENWRRHIASCIKKKEQKDQKVKERLERKVSKRKNSSKDSTSSGLIKNFFKRVKESSELHEDANINLVQGIITVDSVEVDPSMIKEILKEIVEQIPEPVAEKCRGYNPLIDIHTELNATSLKDLNLAVDYKTLHHVSCAGNSYRLSPGCSTANKVCSDLAFSPGLIKAIEKEKNIMIKI